MQEGPSERAGVGQESVLSDGVEPVMLFAGDAPPRVEAVRALAETVVRCVAAGDLDGAHVAVTALNALVRCSSRDEEGPQTRLEVARFLVGGS